MQMWYQPFDKYLYIKCVTKILGVLRSVDVDECQKVINVLHGPWDLVNSISASQPCCAVP